MYELNLSVILPANNEAGNIGALLHEIDGAVTPEETEIIVVDDGSDDSTAKEVLEAGTELGCDCRLIQHNHSAGQSTAIYTGVQAARGQWIITMDGDGQNDPADIPRFVAMAAKQSHTHFCLMGYRKKRRDNAWVRFQSRLANAVRAWALKDQTPDTGCGIKLLPAHTFKQLPYFDHMHRYIPALVRRMGAAVEHICVNHRQRQHGRSKYNAWNRAWAGLVDIVGVRWLIARSRPVHSHEVVGPGHD